MREGFAFEHATPVQAKTLGPITEGKDLVVRAKTGAGKTLSFLLPAMERLKDRPASSSIGLLVVSPVRELSTQIFQEAEKLVKYYAGFRSVCIIGGMSWEEDLQALDAAGSDTVILVATPGRLQSHVSKTPGFSERLAQVQILVLDEVDQIAKNDVFRTCTEDIVASLPSASSRQSLFYSATLSEEVSQLMGRAGKAEHAYIDMLEFEEISVPDQIDQTYSMVKTEGMTLALWKAIQMARTCEEEEPKIVVIFMTGRIAAYYAEAYRKSGANASVFEIHARLNQKQRTEESDRFRAAADGILFTSDVSSRGLDYPGVTDVIQMGAAHSKAEYIHRLGRTGRGGNRGRGLLLLHEFEQSFLKELADLPLTQVQLEGGEDAAMPDFVSMDIPKNVKAQAYYSRINHVMRNSELSSLEILREAKRFAASIGALDKEGRPPEITEENAEKMGILDIRNDEAVYVVSPKTEAAKAPGPSWSWVPQRVPREVWEDAPQALQASQLDAATREALRKGDSEGHNALLRSEVPCDIGAVALAKDGENWIWYRVRGKVNEQQIKKKGKEDQESGTWVRGK
eukprot:TRINITY_DN49986_c0_g1_i1.p1 TRINITY_DN49986_c0_g1~~TRINITY_DN49986_c0_g1_i1.p1  ORF type:complete len:621 (+),score=153.56 TRINITY_DN49986_c0_g1_i1:155-1864(+)